MSCPRITNICSTFYFCLQKSPCLFCKYIWFSCNENFLDICVLCIENSNTCKFNFFKIKRFCLSFQSDSSLVEIYCFHFILNPRHRGVLFKKRVLKAFKGSLYKWQQMFSVSELSTMSTIFIWLLKGGSSL